MQELQLSEELGLLTQDRLLQVGRSVQALKLVRDVAASYQDKVLEQGAFDAEASF